MATSDSFSLILVTEKNSFMVSGHPLSILSTPKANI